MDPLPYSRPPKQPAGSPAQDITQPTVDWTLGSGMKTPVPDVASPDARPYLAPAAPVLKPRPIPDEVKPKVIGGRPYIN